MSSNDTPYNPAEETINSILTGLLPVLIFGLFNGFEDDKKKIISMINIFDDFVIFASITIYPLITALEWYQYYTNFNKIEVIMNYTIIAIIEIISYSFFLFIRYKSENLHKCLLFIRCKTGVKKNENNEQKNEETSISMDEENENEDNEGEINEDGNSIQHEEKKIRLVIMVLYTKKYMTKEQSYKDKK
ncbi:hypothetical protein RhiirA5_397691 [Rhizophagus irregularis]|uniref:Uncharacterized protein n=1 Tax=Rhizophagus irregularis TaxID=588596 RepID=A0A2N0PWD8_9GLOM|nr:hypothetical protein RhiirA5_397691 [Rhizophagus irregularis]